MINQTIFTSATPGDWELKNSSQVVEQIIRPTGLVDPEIEIRPVFNEKTNKSQIDDIISEIKKITIMALLLMDQHGLMVKSIKQ